MANETATDNSTATPTVANNSGHAVDTATNVPQVTNSTSNVMRMAKLGRKLLA